MMGHTAEKGLLHDPLARECVEVGWPIEMLHDKPCPACRAVRALVDLDPDFGPASEGRPFIGTRVTPPGKD